MKQFLTIAAVFGALTSAALAAPQKTSKPAAKAAAKSAVVKCPKCKMALTTKKDKTHTTAVKVHGKTYYCCAACGAHKVAAGKKDDKKKVASTLKCPNCGMEMKTTKGGPMNSTPMKVNGVTYYCCPGCQKS